MGKILLGILATLAIIYLVPFLVYGAFSVLAGMKPPEGASPLAFLVSVLVSKVGTALAFVLIFHLGRSALSGPWLWYAFLWWLMFVIGEVGQAIGPNYGWREAVAGIVSESVYFPLAAFVTHRLLGSG